jgi:hypothetical protein
MVSSVSVFWSPRHVFCIKEVAMEDLGPPLLLTIRELRWLLSAGHSMREALRLHLHDTQNVFTRRLREWWTLRVQDRRSDWQPKSHFQQSFIDVLERGLAGQPTLDVLCALEDEVEKAAQRELDLHLASLPFKVLIPLLLFLFPAFLILLLGPLLRDLSRQLGG